MSPKVYLYKRIVQAKLFIDSHYSDHIDLSQIAEEASFSKFHFIRLFKSCYGKTPHQYLIQVRVQNACRFLQEGFSVVEACEKVGFESITSFTGLFRQHFRKSPALFRQYHQNRKAEIESTPLRFIPNCFAEQKGWTKK